jgi:hypothetical protein
LELELE